ncbi:MAG TPA: excalibur calcium-binding domain-containing protein [Solirubrobacterales bacterium]|nr:excalibur calcium-binding domain-containing protein [Solirubrobacterales bacterium]
MNLRSCKLAPLALVVGAAVLVAPTPAVAGDLDCGDFASQAEAQENLEPGDPDGLDADGDGIACETNPCPCSSATGGGGGGGGDPAAEAPAPPPPYRLSKPAARAEAKRLAQRFVSRSSRVSSLSFGGCQRLAMRRVDCRFTARGHSAGSRTICRLRVAVRARNRQPAGRLTPRCVTRATRRLTVAQALPPIRARASELADKQVPIVAVERSSAIGVRGLAEWTQPAISPPGAREECFALMEATLGGDGSITVELIETDCRPIPS